MICIADEYVAEYISYKPGRPHNDIFKQPDVCKDKPLQKRTGPPAMQRRMATLLPAFNIGESMNCRTIVSECMDLRRCMVCVPRSCMVKYW